MKFTYSSSNEESDDIDIAPMIDVVFLLVLFFMVSSTFAKKDKLFKVELPKAETPKIQALADVTTITITAEGQFYIGDKNVDLNEMKDVLDKEITESKFKSALIKADKNAGYQNVIIAIDMLNLLGVSDIALAVLQTPVP